MRGFGITAASVALIGLTACTSAEDKAATAAAAPAAAEAAGAPQPGEAMAQAFPGCAWGEVTGGGLSVWSYDCPAAAGDYRLAYDAALPGFVMTGRSGGEAYRTPAIVIFKKAADAPIEAILSEVRAKSPGPHTATCVLTTVPGPQGEMTGFEPTGAAKAAWDAAASGEGTEAVEPPCGALGPQMSGDRGFRVLADDPTTVVFIEYGSEIQPFDPATIRKAG